MRLEMTRTLTVSAVSFAALLAFGGAAFADCGVQGAGSIRILSNDFEALRVVNNAAADCATDSVKVTSNATKEHKNIQGPALTANPAEYTVAVVANNSIVPLLNDGLIRPLDELGREIWPVASAEPADQDRRQSHGGRLHGQRPASVLPQGYSGESRP